MYHTLNHCSGEIIALIIPVAGSAGKVPAVQHQKAEMFVCFLIFPCATDTECKKKE
jgi:hypothetical protein